MREKADSKTFAFDYKHLQSEKTKQHSKNDSHTGGSEALKQFSSICYVSGRYFHISFD